MNDMFDVCLCVIYDVYMYVWARLSVCACIFVLRVRD